MLHSIQAQQHHGGRRSGSRPGIKHHRQNYPFFRRPYIEIHNLKSNRNNEIALTRGGIDPKVFDGIVWTIQIHNKNRKLFSKHASRCKMDATQIRNGVDINTHIPLSWKINPFPTICNFPSASYGIDQYTRQLPRRYIGVLTGRPSTPTIIKGSINELMLAFTFSESNDLYLISPPTEEDEIISIPFNELSQYKFLLRFYSNEYEDTQGKLLQLEAPSWDSVKLKRVKS